jgi:hypothetical protein
MAIEDISSLANAIILSNIILSYFISKHLKLGTKNKLIFCSILYFVTGIIYKISSKLAQNLQFVSFRELLEFYPYLMEKLVLLCLFKNK